MRPLPATALAAGIPFYGLLAVFVVLEQHVRVRSLFNRAGARVDRGSFYVLAGAIGGGIGGAFVLAFDVTGAAIGGGGRWPLLGAGLVLMAAGIVLRQWAIALLRTSFTVDVRVVEGQAVVQRGPYHWVRHPSYSGMLLTFAGIGLGLGNWLAIASAVLVPLPAFVVRIRVEEAALLTGLGESYRRYVAGRARLLPGVW